MDNTLQSALGKNFCNIVQSYKPLETIEKESNLAVVKVVSFACIITVFVYLSTILLFPHFLT